MNPRAFWTYLLARLTEPSTWAGLTLIAIEAGNKLAPEYREAIGTVGMLLAGALLAGTREAK